MFSTHSTDAITEPQADSPMTAFNFNAVSLQPSPSRSEAPAALGRPRGLSFNHVGMGDSLGTALRPGPCSELRIRLARPTGGGPREEAHGRTQVLTPRGPRTESPTRLPSSRGEWA